MFNRTLVNASTAASGTSSVAGILEFDNLPDVVCWQIDVSAGTPSIQIQGSVNGVNYYSVGSAITTASITQTVKYPYMRCTWTTNTGTLIVTVN